MKPLVPDAITRGGIRRLLRDRLKEQAERPAATAIAALAAGPVAVAQDAANRQHYEVPPEFFRLVLGPRLKYSGCLWQPGTRTLGQAEEDMLALTCARAGLADGQQVLELGCGWGSLSLYMAARYPASTIHAVSNSRVRIDAMRSEARPSQRLGTRPRLVSPRSSFATSSGPSLKFLKLLVKYNRVFQLILKD